jgi:hypothetical protein
LTHMIVHMHGSPRPRSTHWLNSFSILHVEIHD